MRIQTNVESLNAYRNLNNTNKSMSDSMEKLSSGFRINRAADDAAGLAISEKMRGQVRGLDQSVRNAQDSNSMIQTAEGALNEFHEILQRMRELSVQSANDTNTDADRAEIQAEVDQLTSELSRIAENTEFNSQNLLDGTFEDTVFHIGANQGQNIELSVDDMSAQELNVEAGRYGEIADIGDGTEVTVSGGSKEAYENVTVTFDEAVTEGIDVTDETLTITLEEGTDADPSSYTAADINEIIQNAAEAEGNEFGGTAEGAELSNISVSFEGEIVLNDTDSAAGTTTLDQQAEGGIDVSSQGAADAAITTINNAIESVSSQRSELGAVQNRLDHTIANLEVASENLQAAESRIRDVDMAQEMTNFSKQQILEQAGTAMLAQANQAPQSVLQLLG